MSTEENKAIVKRFYEQVVGTGNVDLLDDYLAELKKKYAQMGAALDSLQQSSDSIQSFNKQQSTTP